MPREPSEYRTLKLAGDGGIATITLDRPRKRNPLSAQAAEELVRALAEVESGGEARVVILTGAGPSFCAGLDTGELQDQGPIGIGDHERLVEMFDRLALRIVSCELPTIAAVNGPAIGGGMALAIACDIRLASEDARIGAAFIRRGSSAADMGVSYILPRLVGPAWAAELMFTGETIDARQAERIGLFTHVVPRDQLLPAARDLASRIAAGPPLGLRFTKRGLFRSVWSGLERDLEWEAAVQTICTRSGDFEEAWKAYFEKRKPHFRGA